MLVSYCIIVLGNENLGIIWPRNAKKQKWNWLIFPSATIPSLQGQGTKQVLCGLQCYSWVCHWLDLSPHMLGPWMPFCISPLLSRLTSGCLASKFSGVEQSQIFCLRSLWQLQANNWKTEKNQTKSMKWKRSCTFADLKIQVPAVSQE